MKQGALHRASFFLGVFLVTGGTLALQIVQTRILSVMTWYYLAFLSIGIAMLGLATGGLWVYRNRRSPDQRLFARDIVFFSLAFAVSLVATARIETLVNPLAESTIWAMLSWFILMICLTVPFFSLASWLVCSSPEARTVSAGSTASIWPVPRSVALRRCSSSISRAGRRR